MKVLLIKEVILGQIDLLYSINEPVYDPILFKLIKALDSCESIQDIQRKAFEAGKAICGNTDITWAYDTFEDYLLKTKE